MSSFKSFLAKNLLLLALIAVVYAWFFAFHYVPQKIQNTSHQVLGASANVTIFIQPESGRKPIIDAINNAQKEILVAVYLMSDKEIIQALSNAKKRGVNVDVMLEKHPFGGGNLNNKTKTDLESNNISFSWTNPSFTLTHEKAIVIDGILAFILNQNLTTSSFTKNREYNVLDLNPEDVKEIRNMFINDWERKPFTPSKTTNLIVSPINSRSAVATLINSATQTIDLELEILVDEQLASLISEKAKTIQIRLITPTFSQISANEKNARKLKESGVLVRTLSSPYVHAKLILVDGKKAYVGSVNLSPQSMDENRELGIILSQSQSLQSLSSTFESDWNNGKDIN